MRTRRHTSSSSNPVARKGGSAEGHRSVLLHEVLQASNLTGSEVVVDCTLGGAGHTRALAQGLTEQGVVVGIDADPEAVDRARKALKGVAPQVRLVVGNFRHLRTHLHQARVERADVILIDLGWSSYQLDAKRGFSFLADEPLIMTYGNPDTYAFTAYHIVNEWAEESIADILHGWGEERFARRIARAIVSRRELKPITKARELGDLIAHAVPSFYARGRLHPATKTFQALRIAVNDELGAIHDVLTQAQNVLSPGGRMLMITFHSIEDRAVKRMFKEWEKHGIGAMQPKRPIKPSAQEIEENPRARSAKLRVFIKQTV